MKNERSKAVSIQNKIGMTIEEAAAYTGIGRNTLRQLVKHEKLPVLLIGRKNIIKAEILERFLNLNQGINLLDLEMVRAVSDDVLICGKQNRTFE